MAPHFADRSQSDQDLWAPNYDEPNWGYLEGTPKAQIPAVGAASASQAVTASNVIAFDQLLQTMKFDKVNNHILYKCPVCIKTFHDKKDFRRHYMIHTGERPHACPLCQYKARLLCTLKQHIQKIHHQPS